MALWQCEKCKATAETRQDDETFRRNAAGDVKMVRMVPCECGGEMVLEDK